MKLYLPTFTIALCTANASLSSWTDRSSATVLKTRPRGEFRLIDAISNTRSLQNQDYSTINGHTCFRDIEGMNQAMFDLEKNYPDLVSISDIGDSYAKTAGDSDGRDIYVMKITASTDADRAQVLLTGGQHAREYAPPELLMRFAEKLVTEYDENADITWVLDTTQINVVLYVNPDGRAIAETQPDLYWRKNSNPNDGKCGDDFIGTDLNRNYDWMWGDTSGASNDPCDEDYHGSGPASEPEVQAIIAYAKTLFPDAQRKSDPEAEKDVPFGEDITGVYMDIHSYGGLTYFPWGYANVPAPDNDSLEAFARKISFFNGYVLWAGGQPDFLYPVTGDASDYMYAHLGVASLGLEIGDDFYQDCNSFEQKVYPDNLNTLMYTIKLAKKPNAIAKGPDVLDLTVTEADSNIIVSVYASDSELVNIDGYPSFTTGEQSIVEIVLYLDVHPDEYGSDDIMYILQPLQIANSDRVFVETEIPIADLSSGKHALYATATDSAGYTGPWTSVFFEVKNAAIPSPIQPTQMPSFFDRITTTSFATTFTIATIETEPSSNSLSGHSTGFALTDSFSDKQSISPINEVTMTSPTNLQTSSLSPSSVLTTITSSQPTLALTIGELPTSGPADVTANSISLTPTFAKTRESEPTLLSQTPSDNPSMERLDRNFATKVSLTIHVSLGLFLLCIVCKNS